jgi:hypothetical protein
VLLPVRPEGEIPELPRDLADVPDRPLMELFSTYVQWNNYLDVIFVDAEVAEAQAETNVKIYEATSMTGWDPKDKVTFARAERDADPEMVRLRREFEQAKAYRKMLGVMSNNMERGAALLSRELTRRVGRAPVEGRLAGWGT